MSETQRVLVVDGELEARLLISRLLEAEGFDATLAADASEALSALHGHRFEYVLLDVQLSDLDGFECCRRIRRFSSVPVIMLTAVNDTKSVVRGLDSGADDYIVKPFEREELLARMRAVRRRIKDIHAERTVSAPIVTVGQLQLDFSSQVARFGPIDLDLSGKEFQLLYILASNVGSLLSRDSLFNAVWDDDVYNDSKTLDVHISRLRKKLNLVGGYGPLLKTIRNRGYLLSTKLSSATPTTLLAAQAQVL